MPIDIPTDDTTFEHFLHSGYLRVKQGLPRALREEQIAKLWVRLACDPHDPATWPAPMYRLGVTQSWSYREHMPEVFDKACKLVGGEDRINPQVTFGNGLLVNFNQGADQGWVPPSAQAGGWHKDGDFFKHFLDSPEQGLLVLVLWDRIDHQGGGTFFAADSPGVVARHLVELPEGTWGAPAGELIKLCTDFREVTGEGGDVILLHPYMLHAGSHNVSGRPRLLSNPCISLLEPMCFGRDNPADHSPVEQVILNGLGVEKFDFKITAEREKTVPARVGEQDDRKKIEQERLAAAGYVR